MNIIDITDILVEMKRADDLTTNEREALKHVGIAYSSARSANTYPQGRKNYFRHCRNSLEKALVYLNEELDGEQDES